VRSVTNFIIVNFLLKSHPAHSYLMKASLVVGKESPITYHSIHVDDVKLFMSCVWDFDVPLCDMITWAQNGCASGFEISDVTIGNPDSGSG
jgi:hypothetical protein